MNGYVYFKPNAYTYIVHVHEHTQTHLNEKRLGKYN